MPIHPTAIIDGRAEIDPSADIGAFVLIDGPVIVGPRTRVSAHAVLMGATVIGTDNVIHVGAAIGDYPQDQTWKGTESYVRIGDRNVFREHCQIHRASKPGGATSIGNDNYLMTNTHVGHDCHIGDLVIMATGAVLGGHVVVEDQAYISGNCVVHQFVRIGRLALLRGLSKTSRDVPPFCLMDDTHTLRTLNRVGLRRAGFSAEQIRALQRAFVTLFGQRRHLRQAIAEVEAQPCTAEVEQMLAFIRASTRGVAFGPRSARPADD